MSFSYKKMVCVALLTLTGGLALAEGRSYTEGAVTEVSWIRTKPGMFDAYMAWLGGERKKEMEAFLKAGIIVAYHVYSTAPRSPQDADLILTVTYKNMAALDGLDDRTDAIDKQIFGSMDDANKAAISREQMRTVIGTQLVRELISK
jgi:hypothetical protein